TASASNTPANTRLKVAASSRSTRRAPSCAPATPPTPSSRPTFQSTCARRAWATRAEHPSTRIVTKEVPTACRCERPRKIRKGTTRKPPPRPVKADAHPTSTPNSSSPAVSMLPSLPGRLDQDLRGRPLSQAQRSPILGNDLDGVRHRVPRVHGQAPAGHQAVLLQQAEEVGTLVGHPRQAERSAQRAGQQRAPRRGRE